MNETTVTTVKAAIAAAVATMTALWGWFGWLVIAWVLLMLMAGGVACFGGGCWLAVRRKRQSGEEPPWDWRKR